MKAVVAAFNQEKALVGAFSVITNLRMDRFTALLQDRAAHRLQELGAGGGAGAQPSLAFYHWYYCYNKVVMLTELIENSAAL